MASLAAFQQTRNQSSALPHRRAMTVITVTAMAGEMKRKMTLTSDCIEARHRGSPPAEGRVIPRLSDTEVEASLDEALAEAGDAGLWLFAYGSLLWRPDFPHNESRIARIYGYHRRFCLWQWRWRGSDAAPNLMLALAPGGCCTGLAYRIEGPGLREKLGPLWRREMAGDGYRPRFLRAVTEAGPLRVAAFVANRRGERYAGRLPDDRVAAILAWARGHGGTGAEYLLKTTLAMEALGERDHMLWRMQHLVAENLK